MTSEAYPWSYSSLKLFQQCPKKYFHLRVAKDYKEPEGEHLRYGNEFHKAAEKFMERNEVLPAKFNFALPALEQLKTIPGKKYCELKLGLTEDLEPCGFFHREKVWWRGAVDLLIINEETGVARLIDYKTGANTKYAETDQLQLLSLAVFKQFPQVKVIKGGLLYVVCNAFIKDTYTVERAPEMWESWIAQYRQMERAHAVEVWNPNPSGLCKNFCVVSECQHNGKNK